MSAYAKVEWFTEHNHHVRGIVHVGANDGEEIPWYLEHGYVPILAFEPNPSVFAVLRETYGEKVRCENCALGLISGTMTLHIPRHLHDPELFDDKGASGLHVDMMGARRIGWTPTDTVGIEVPVRRLDEWDLRLYNTLVIDVQGMELDVLMGADLSGIENISVELSAVPVYLGEAPAQEVCDWLTERGFERMTEIEPHNDVFFCR